MKKKMGFLALLVLTSNAIADLKLPSPEVETLGNGMRVAWFLDDKLPIVDLALVVNAGFRDDPEGKSGTVNLLSQLLERGSNGVSSAEMARRIEALGASEYSDADDDSFSLGFHGLSKDAEQLLQYLGWMVLSPNFDTKEFKSSQDRIRDQWKHLADSAESLAGFAFARTITNGSEYSRGSVRSFAEFNRVKLDDIKSFYKTYFTPKNSILAVVGRVDRVKFRELLIKKFGAWKGEAPKHKWKSYRDPRFANKPGEVILVDRPELPQAQIRIGFKVPGLHWEPRYALSVGNALLGEFFNSRLNSVIRDRLGLTYGISSAVNHTKDFSYLGVTSSTANPNVGKLMSETLSILKSMKDGDILSEEVAYSKDYLLGGYPLSVSTLGAIATRWLSGVVYDLGPDFLNEYVAKVRAVERKDVVDAVGKAFDLSDVVMVVSGDAKKIEPSLREFGFKKIRKLSSKGLML